MRRVKAHRIKRTVARVEFSRPELQAAIDVMRLAEAFSSSAAIWAAFFGGKPEDSNRFDVLTTRYIRLQSKLSEALRQLS